MIVAIDPGYEQSAVVVLEGTVQFATIDTNEKILDWIIVGGEGYRSPLAIEMVASYGMPVGKEVFETCVWIGRFIEAWSSCRPEPAIRIYRKEVKSHLCGSVKATDANVRAALIDLFGPGKRKAIGLKASPGPLYGFKADMWAALAVAVTYEDTKEARRVRAEAEAAPDA